MANQTVVSAASIWQALFDTITGEGQSMDFMKTGEVYFVDANSGHDGNSGADWDHAFLTLKYALSVSHMNIGGSSKGWSARNKIYCKGSFDEDLTKLADKTDVIGVGTAGTRARLIGTQAPTDRTYATRMINWEFRDDGSTAMWTLTAGGMEFHNCWFRQWYAITGTHGLLINDPSDVVIDRCKFTEWHGTKFSTAAIELTTTVNAANVQNCYITNNIICGAEGIKVGEGVFSDCWIANNHIDATTFCIRDISVESGAEGFFIVNNKMLTAANQATLGDVLDFNPYRAVDNILTGSTGTIRIPVPITEVKATPPITAGRVYYVHKGGDNKGGLSWKNAFTTIAAAIAAHKAYRATISSAQKSIDSIIYIAPATYNENITDLPYSCTMIGLGVRGTDKATEWNTTTGACIAGTVSGLRLINIRFEAGGANDLLDFNICNNVEIIDCDFQCKDDDNVAAISTENANNLTIRNCRIGSGGLTTFEYGIYASGGASKYFQNCVVENNVIEGLNAAGTGIFIHGDAVNDRTIIKDNVIRLTGAGTGISIGAGGSSYKTSMVIGNFIFTQAGTWASTNTDLAINNWHNNGTTVTNEPNMPT